MVQGPYGYNGDIKAAAYSNSTTTIRGMMGTSRWLRIQMVQLPYGGTMGTSRRLLAYVNINSSGYVIYVGVRCGDPESTQQQE
jgi:hypothetical protein